MHIDDPDRPVRRWGKPLNGEVIDTFENGGPDNGPPFRDRHDLLGREPRLQRSIADRTSAT